MKVIIFSGFKYIQYFYKTLVDSSLYFQWSARVDTPFNQNKNLFNCGSDLYFPDD